MKKSKKVRTKNVFKENIKRKHFIGFMIICLNISPKKFLCKERKKYTGCYIEIRNKQTKSRKKNEH